MTTIEFEVQRYRSDGDEKTSSQRYTLQVKPGMTVLDGLLHIREQLDATLTWRFSCRMSVCGSCTMIINGRPGLACNTQILDVSDARIRLQPMHNFAVVKDLLVDLKPMFHKHRALKPYIIRPKDEQSGMPTGDYQQSPNELLDYLQFADCIKCGACMAACPTLAVDSRFLGPMPLTAAHRYNTDSRDSGFTSRKVAMTDFHGASHCHYAAECSRVCPKGVDPARAVQLLRRSLVLDALHLRRSQPAARVLPPASKKRTGSIPTPPPFSVDS